MKILFSESQLLSPMKPEPNIMKLQIRGEGLFIRDLLSGHQILIFSETHGGEEVRRLMVKIHSLQAESEYSSSKVFREMIRNILKQLQQLSIMLFTAVLNLNDILSMQ